MWLVFVFFTVCVRRDVTLLCLRYTNEYLLGVKAVLLDYPSALSFVFLSRLVSHAESGIMLHRILINTLSFTEQVFILEFV